MTDQMERVSAPSDNEGGWARAVEQIKRGALGNGWWIASYDSLSDTFSLRRAKAAHGRGAVSYFMPSRPEILVRLDLKTGDLTGIDLTNFKRFLVKVDPNFGSAWRAWQMFHLAERLPKFVRPYLAGRSPRKKVGPRVQAGILGGCGAT